MDFSFFLDVVASIVGSIVVKIIELIVDHLR